MKMPFVASLQNFERDSVHDIGMTDVKQPSHCIIYPPVLLIPFVQEYIEESQPGRRPKKRSSSIESELYLSPPLFPDGSSPPRCKGSPREGRGDGILTPSPISRDSVSFSLSGPRRARFRAISPQIGERKTLIFIPSKCVISPARLETLRGPLPSSLISLPGLQPSRIPVPWCVARVFAHIRAHAHPRGRN